MLLHEKYAHLEFLEDLVPLSLRIVRFKVMGLRRKAARRGQSRLVSIEDIPLPDPDASPADDFFASQVHEAAHKGWPRDRPQLEAWLKELYDAPWPAFPHGSGIPSPAALS